MRKVIRQVMVAALAVLPLASVSPAGADVGNGNNFPDLGDCQRLHVESGNIVAFQAYGVGVQIYRWNGTNWDFVEPQALLFRGSAVVATHFAGPTWESDSGSQVVGETIDHCTPDPDSIAWLLLKAKSTEGAGIFEGVTFIQRLNTVGGVAPAEPGDFVGDVAKVPYAAKYVFYRKP